MAEVVRRECPVCGRAISAPNFDRHVATHEASDADAGGGAEAPYRTDLPPRPKAAAKSSKGSSPAGIPLAVQLQLPYRLLANVTASRMPATSHILEVQAGPCADAWDQFLMRYPALREKIEQGMIAGDVIALIMAHLPIVQIAREEIAARARAMESYEGGVPTPAAA